MQSLQTPATEGQKPALAYAPRRPAVIGFLRRYIGVTLLLLVAASAVWWGPFVWHRAHVLYWQGRCASYTAAPDAVIVDESAYAGRSTGVAPPEWANFYRLVSPPGLVSDGTVFLHMLRRPSGEPVLVAVDLVVSSRPFGGNPRLQFRAFRPGRAARLPVLVQDDLQPMFLSGPSLSEYQHLRILAGQPDPADPTHLTIKYQADDKQYVVDGWVRGHGVVLEWRPQPSLSPPTSAAKSP